MEKLLAISYSFNHPMQQELEQNLDPEETQAKKEYETQAEKEFEEKWRSLIEDENESIHFLSIVLQNATYKRDWIVKFFEKHAKLGNPLAINHLGIMSLGQGYFAYVGNKTALEYFEQSAQLDCGLASFNCGEIYIQKKEYEKAINAFKKAFDKDILIERIVDNLDMIFKKCTDGAIIKLASTLYVHIINADKTPVANIVNRYATAKTNEIESILLKTILEKSNASCLLSIVRSLYNFVSGGHEKQMIFDKIVERVINNKSSPPPPHLVLTLATIYVQNEADSFEGSEVMQDKILKLLEDSNVKTGKLDNYAMMYQATEKENLDRKQRVYNLILNSEDSVDAKHDKLATLYGDGRTLQEHRDEIFNIIFDAESKIENPYFPKILILCRSKHTLPSQLEKVLKIIETSIKNNDFPSCLWNFYTANVFQRSKLEKILEDHLKTPNLKNDDVAEASYWLGSMYSINGKNDKAMALLTSSFQLGKERAIDSLVPLYQSHEKLKELLQNHAKIINENSKLKILVDEMRTQIDYQPDGVGYLIAMKECYDAVKKPLLVRAKSL